MSLKVTIFNPRIGDFHLPPIHSAPITASTLSMVKVILFPPLASWLMMLSYSWSNVWLWEGTAGTACGLTTGVGPELKSGGNIVVVLDERGSIVVEDLSLGERGSIVVEDGERGSIVVEDGERGSIVVEDISLGGIFASVVVEDISL